MTFSVFLIAALTAAAPEPRRFALVIGENQGVGSEETLHFAQDDARRMADALREVGLVRAQDLTALYGATVDDVRVALTRFEQRLRSEATVNDQLLLYISSHADEGQLHLRGEAFGMRELTAFLQRAPVGVAILIVDSCRSGTLTRLKGLRPLAGSSVSVETPELSGRVIISSSGADEYAQESERLRGSYFTHHLVAGMRGAADFSKDGRVTLQEAYAYAYARTVETTFASPVGSQHPNYSVDLKGRGELILSELTKDSATLRIDSDLAREWLVLKSDGTSLVGQLVKEQGPALLAFSPGAYRVRARFNSGFREAVVQLAAGAVAFVSDQNLGPMQTDVSLSKGGRPAPWSIGLGPGLGSSAVNGTSAALGGEARLEYRLARRLWVFNDLAASLIVRRSEALGEVRFRQLEYLLAVGSGRSIDVGSFTLLGHLQAGLALTRQDQIASELPRVSVQPFAAVNLSLEWNFTRVVGLRIGGFLGASRAFTTLGVSVRPIAHANGSVVIHF